MPEKKYAMVLAAGRGERLRPLTDSTPKPLLKTGQRMLIEHHLYALANAGYSDVVINIGHLGQQIMDSLGDGSRYRLSLHYSDERDAVLETGGGIFKALRWLKSDNFLVINGDIWTDIDLTLLPDNISSLAHLVLVNNPAHHPEGDFSLTGDKVKPRRKKEPSWTFSGIGVYSHALFQDCEEGRFPLAPLLREQMEQGRITGQVYDGLWFDIGTEQRLKDLKRMLEQSENP